MRANPFQCQVVPKPKGAQVGVPPEAPQCAFTGHGIALWRTWKVRLRE